MDQGIAFISHITQRYSTYLIVWTCCKSDKAGKDLVVPEMWLTDWALLEIRFDFVSSCALLS